MEGISWCEKRQLACSLQAAWDLSPRGRGGGRMPSALRRALPRRPFPPYRRSPPRRSPAAASSADPLTPTSANVCGWTVNCAQLPSHPSTRRVARCLFARSRPPYSHRTMEYPIYTCFFRLKFELDPLRLLKALPKVDLCTVCQIGPHFLCCWSSKDSTFFSPDYSGLGIYKVGHVGVIGHVVSVLRCLPFFMLVFDEASLLGINQKCFK